MHDNYLLIVEGSKTEQNIFTSILTKYGFNVIKSNKKVNIDNKFYLDRFDLNKDMQNIIVIEGPKNRIHDFLVMYNDKEESIEKYFELASDSFKGIFLIYDVDHNDKDDIKLMYNKFSDESSGMLLLSSPCIEVLGEYDLNRVVKYNHLKQYKKELNIYYSDKNKMSTEEFIIKNFEKLCIIFLKKNHDEFNEDNIMEHPEMIIDSINKYNERINFSGEDKNKSYVIYRYFTTVVYVFIAYINGLTRKIDNYNDVLSFFKSKLQL